MAEIDEFAGHLLDEAKRFLEKAIEASDPIAVSAFLHAALMMGFCSLEAHVNAVADEIAQRPGFSTHEQAFLLEEDVRLENGQFQAGGLKMVRLEDRILFLHRRMSGKPLDKSLPWWGHLTTAITLRNRLTHPKGAPNISTDDIKRATEAIIQCIDSIYRAVYGRPFPFAGFGLDSRMMF